MISLGGDTGPGPCVRYLLPRLSDGAVCVAWRRARRICYNIDAAMESSKKGTRIVYGEHFYVRIFSLAKLPS